MLRKKLKNNNIYFILAYIFFFVSCDKNRVFDAYVSLEKGAWQQDKPVLFSFTVKDTISKNNLFINIRNNNKYAFSNLFVITAMHFPNGNKIIDTLEYKMADAQGKFLGSGFISAKENKLFYKENVVFPTRGEYTFKITQAMRKNGGINGINNLEGITEVGFRIEKINP